MKKIKIKDKVGLHARPVAQFCSEATKYESSISLRKGDRIYNGKSPIMLLSAGIEYNDTVELIAQGVDAAEAETKLSQLLEAMGS